MAEERWSVAVAEEESKDSESEFQAGNQIIVTRERSS